MLATFAPACQDCGYNLEGLPDNRRCPECGLWYTHAELKRLWLAKHARKQHRLGKIINAFFMILMVGPVFFVRPDDYRSIAAITGWYMVLVLLWVTLNRNRWIAYSYCLIGFLVPLAGLLLLIAPTPIGLPGTIAIAIFAGLLSRLALYWSPLDSARLLAGFFVLPAMGWGLLMIVTAYSDASAGLYWSRLDQPTPFGWRAVPVTVAPRAGLLIIGVAALLGIMIAAYARRAIVRLRARSKRPDTAG